MKHRAVTLPSRAFTLIELLVVVAIISLLAAVLLPVFASVRAKGRQTVCTSNLRQIGLAVALYAQDADDVLPLGGDPGDVNTNEWQGVDNGKYWAEAQQMRPLHEVLHPYTASDALWGCPSDTGYQAEAFGGGAVLSASPSGFAAYGCSYGYHTELAFRQETLSGMAAYDRFPPYAQRGASEINLLSDESGHWHGGYTDESQRFNVLMGDGHVKTLPFDALNVIFSESLDPHS